MFWSAPLSHLYLFWSILHCHQIHLCSAQFSSFHFWLPTTPLHPRNNADPPQTGISDSPWSDWHTLYFQPLPSYSFFTICFTILHASSTLSCVCASHAGLSAWNSSSAFGFLVLFILWSPAPMTPLSWSIGQHPQLEVNFHSSSFSYGLQSSLYCNYLYVWWI